MTKWMIALAAVCWICQDSLAAIDMNSLAAYRDYLMALGIALVVQPWFVHHLEG